MNQARNSDSKTHVEKSNPTSGTDLSSKTLRNIFLGHPVEERKFENFGQFRPKTLTIKRTKQGSESSTLIIEINPNESQKLPDLAFCYHWFRVFSDQANRSKLVKHSVSEPQ